MLEKTILLIEDDDVLRKIIKEFLEESEYVVLKAKDGLEGIEMINKEAFDLIIVDVVLPHVSGIGVIEIAKTRYPEIPIICITGYGYFPEKLAEEKHADIVLNKPFELKKLVEVIETLLEQKAGRNT
ncbi:MAG: response regulator [Deltaproteobacteria bacterium]|nr:response regulator [Deltaproteobacteria bacterium]MBW2661216.1 response regulator [Deltaproteobacteria bacterium]